MINDDNSRKAERAEFIVMDRMLFVKRNIRMGSRIAGTYREDIYELPIDSIREMISNAVCHRSYVAPGSIQVAIYDDRLEVTSPGRISPDMTMEQLMEGNSRVRNVAIGAAFQYMHIIERWGTGIPRIIKEAREYGLKKPELKDFGTSFRINIFRKEAETDQYGVVKPADLSTADSGSATKETTKETTKEILMRAMRENPAITVKELAPIVGLTEDGVRYHIKKMRVEGKLEREGSTKAGKWIVLK